LCPPTSENDFENDYLIEAKIEQYLNVVDLNNARKKIAKQMEAARKNAESLKGNPGIFVAMAFLSLRFVDEKLDSLEHKTNDVISHIRNQSPNQKDFDAIGAIWMGARDFQRSKEERKKYPEWGNNVHFGMVLLASRIEI
jgi:lantibiotic modifying enzyme